MWVCVQVDPPRLSFQLRLQPQLKAWPQPDKRLWGRGSQVAASWSWPRKWWSNQYLFVSCYYVLEKFITYHYNKCGPTRLEISWRPSLFPVLHFICIIKQDFYQGRKINPLSGLWYLRKIQNQHLGEYPPPGLQIRGLSQTNYCVISCKGKLGSER